MHMQDSDYVQSINSAAAPASIVATLRELADELGLAHLTYIPTGSLSVATALEQAISTYPDCWIERYHLNNYRHIDPITKRSIESSLPYEWSLAMAKEPDVLLFLEDARQHGVGLRGFAFPVLGVGGAAGVFSVTSNHSDREWEALPLALVRHITTAAYAVQNRVHEMRTNELPKPNLSKGEAACLSFLMNGETPKSAAARLGVSESRVRAALQKACKKLQSKTSTQAVVSAMTAGLLD